MRTRVRHQTIVVTQTATKDRRGLLISVTVTIGIIMMLQYLAIPAIRRYGPNSINLPVMQASVSNTMTANMK